MIGFSIFGERILILNDREDAEELVCCDVFVARLIADTPHS
jgi:hypothetical protein